MINVNQFIGGVSYWREKREKECQLRGELIGGMLHLCSALCFGLGITSIVGSFGSYFLR
jgi:hypothetical protein